MTTSTRATLLERLRDGADALAWDEFFARYWPTIYGFARHRGCSQHTAEEIVQDVMLKVFQQRDVYRYNPSRGRFRDWLHTVVRNQVAEHRRRPANRVRGVGGGAAPAGWSRRTASKARTLLGKPPSRTACCWPSWLRCGERRTPARIWPLSWSAWKVCRAAKRRGSPAFPQRRL